MPPSVVLCGQFILTSFSRSSSGFCEKFAGNGGSDPAQAEDSRSAHMVDPASFFLELNSNGELVTRALADLDLSDNAEVLGRNNKQHSKASCDGAKLPTPVPGAVVSDQEAKPIDPGAIAVQARDGSSEQQLLKDQGESNQWAALSSVHKGKSQEFCVQINGRIQSMTDIPATSTPKKQKMNGQESTDTTQILEGQFEGSGYHRDGTRVGTCKQTSLFLSKYWW